MSQAASGREASGTDAGGAAGAVATPGRTSRVAARYPALGAAMAKRGGAGGEAGEATIDEVATVAVENPGGGRAVDAGVARQVGGHLGADFGGVRVHDDGLAQEASAAMGARAFAYGSDVFLGPGESDRDLGLMAHELTHVVQQGAAGEARAQRQVQVGAADSPAEREADAVAGAVTAGAKPASLLVDDGAPQQADGQMTVSEFIAQLRPAVTAAADAALGPGLSAIGCPYIDTYFARYAGRPAREGEAMLRKFEPGLAGCGSAAAMIPLVVARVTRGVQAWNATGALPAELAGMDPGGGGGAAGAPAGGAAPGTAARAMGPGAALDGAAARVGGVMGADLGAVRVHTGPEAARFAADRGAAAVTVGRDVAFAAGAYQPGTIEGDALLAHELAHVVQQAPAADGPAPALAAVSEAGAALEDDADQAAVGAVAAMHGDDERVKRSPLGRLKDGVVNLARSVGPSLRSSVSLARCGSDERATKTGVHYAKGASPGSSPSPETWGLGATEDDAETKEQLLKDAKTMNAGGVFVFYGHGSKDGKIKASDDEVVTAGELSKALGADSNPPTLVVLGACSTSSMMAKTAESGVPIVAGFDDTVNGLYLSVGLDTFMSKLKGGATFAAAETAANDKLAAQSYAMGQMTIQYADGYSSDMTLEGARSHHKSQ